MSCCTSAQPPTLSKLPWCKDFWIFSLSFNSPFAVTCTHTPEGPGGRADTQKLPGKVGRGKHEQLASWIFISVDLCYKISNAFLTHPSLFRPPCPFNLTRPTTLPVSSQLLNPTPTPATVPSSLPRASAMWPWASHPHPNPLVPWTGDKACSRRSLSMLLFCSCKIQVTPVQEKYM